MHTIPDGVWPTLTTPYKEDGEIDYAVLERQIDWYLENGASGLFAVCQSSEMFNLSLRERLELARASVRFAGGRVPVIASGHVAPTIRDQAEEARMMADTGVAAVVLVSNRLAGEREGDDAFKRNLESFLGALGEGILLGFYECPAPYKRLLSPEAMRFAASTGRFGFLKDTSCSVENIEAKLAIVKGTGFKVFNANSATLLDSLRAGASGYSGVMANFHTDLYAWLCENWKAEPERAEELQAFLGLSSVIEYQYYPVSGKYAFALAGLPYGLSCRRLDAARFGEPMKREVRQLMAVSRSYSERFRRGGR